MHIPYASCMVYQNDWAMLRANVGKCSIYGACGHICVYNIKVILTSNHGRKVKAPKKTRQYQTNPYLIVDNDGIRMEQTSRGTKEQHV